MIEPSVTMPLSRFKELENAEQTLVKIIEYPNSYLLRYTYSNGWAAISNSDNAQLIEDLRYAIESRDKAYKKNKELEYKIEYEMKKKGGFWS